MSSIIYSDPVRAVFQGIVLAVYTFSNSSLVYYTGILVTWMFARLATPAQLLRGHTACYIAHLVLKSTSPVVLKVPPVTLCSLFILFVYLVLAMNQNQAEFEALSIA